MSYSSQLKEELGSVIDKARHCRIAEIAAIISFNGHFNEAGLEVITENETVVDLYKELLKMVFDVTPEESEVTDQRRKKAFVLRLPYKTGDEKIKDIFEALKMTIPGDGIEGKMPDIKMITSKNCCKRAFLRGAFISVGSISNPDKSYHFELNCREKETCDIVEQMLKSLSFDAKQVKRQKYEVVYVKDGSQIVDIIGMMGARTGLLDFENMRIVREVRGNVNRRVNCETANINKTARASARQIEDIIYIKEHMGFESLPIGLDEMARVRLQCPEATLGELGLKLEPPVGKSGVNHRLRKLSMIAETLRNQEEEKR